MKASDITDEQFLNALREAQRRRQAPLGLMNEVVHVLAGHPEVVVPYGPDWTFIQADYEHMPTKVVRAKAGRLIERGIITGCACGCRGDLEITDVRVGADAVQLMNAQPYVDPFPDAWT